MGVASPSPDPHIFSLLTVLSFHCNPFSDYTKKKTLKDTCVDSARDSPKDSDWYVCATQLKFQWSLVFFSNSSSKITRNKSEALEALEALEA
jgi:hypothetical protein